jgi:hypothetical protein
MMIAAKMHKRARVDLAALAVRVRSIARGLRKAAGMWIGPPASDGFRARVVTIWRSRCLLPQVEPFNLPTTPGRPSTDTRAALEYCGSLPVDELEWYIALAATHEDGQRPAVPPGHTRQARAGSSWTWESWLRDPAG